MLKSRLLIALILICLFTHGLFSQTFSGFSPEPDKYLLELTEFFKNVSSSNKKESEELIKNFTLIWNSGRFKEAQIRKIIEVSNLMRKRRMKAFPQFKEYLLTLMSFANGNHEETSFMAWFSSLDNLISRSSSNQYISYLQQSRYLVADNYIYSAKATKWHTGSSYFHYEYDTTIRVVFESLNLTCYANNDSSVIYNTKGIYYPLTYKWIGRGGKIDWTRAGFNENEVYAELDYYDIFVKYSKFTADSVIFHNKKFFSSSLLGRLEEKVLANVKTEKASYPRFQSYDTRFRIRNIFPNIDYEGAFSMKGARFIGGGSQDQNAYLIFKKDGKDFVVIAAKTYTIRKDRVSTRRASVTIYFEGDSIYHPGLQMKYMDKTKELSLIRTKEGLSASPFFNSYHKVDMYCEAMYWKVDEPKIDFRMIRGIGSDSKATFESADYYTEFKFYKLQGMDEIHPLHVVRNYSRYFNTNEMKLEQLARFWRAPLDQVEPIVINLANMGFIVYDIENKSIHIKDRLYKYLGAKNGKTDYDVIKINSVISALSNATLSLIDFDLLLRGVQRVYLSDSQMVYIYPYEQEITLKKNRDFIFDGYVNAGKFDFFAHQCSFEYDKFKLNMPLIDSMRFRVKSFERNKYGEYHLVRVKTVIANLSGDILIDNPGNKSGLQSFDEYPIFNSKNDAYVYYDKKTIHQGVYTRDNFYFHVFPFTIDSLVKFSTEGLEFNGYLKSAGIFPDIEEPLKVQPDYSLGFVTPTPSPGLPSYGEKGMYYATIDLSHKGLRGNGKLEYLTSTTSSDEFFFYPDSTNAVAQWYEVKEQLGVVEYPSVAAQDVYMHWLPYEDLMKINQIDKPIPMYNNNTKLHGSLALSPSIMTGEGMMEFEDAEIESNLYRFKQHEFDSDTADFKLKTYDLTELAFSTHNYKSHIDFEKRKGEFISNGGGSLVEFPVNQYICYMDEFDWYMDKDEIAMTSNKKSPVADIDKLDVKDLVDIELSGSEFISIHPAQDSLRFYSAKGRFNLKNNIITGVDVKIIKVADAAIIPDKGEVIILKKAEMKTLKNAVILANTTTKYHTIYDAVVNVYSRKKYSASGYYDYIDKRKNRQKIKLDTIAVDTTLQTFGYGKIAKEDGFTLSPNFAFTGDVKLLASNEFLNFHGGCKIHHNCDTLDRYWLKFTADINPEEIRIPIMQGMRNLSNDRIFSSILFSHTAKKIYPAFLAKKIKYSDTEIVKAYGYLMFDEVSKEYRIGSKEKLEELTLPGNYLSFSRNKCIAYGEGRLNLGTKTGQLKVQTFGNVKHYISMDTAFSDSTEFEAMILLDFYFNDESMKLFSNKMHDYSTLDGVGFGEMYTKALAEIVGTDDADEAISDINLYGYIKNKKIVSKLEHTLTLTDVKLKWNDVTKSFVSTGPIGIGNIQKEEINKYVDGYVEIAKKRSGDIINIYLEPDPSDWYYFSYSRSLMQAISSDKEFNSKIIETKPDKRKMNVKSGEVPYRYTKSTTRRRREFLKKMQQLNE